MNLNEGERESGEGWYPVGRFSCTFLEDTQELLPKIRLEDPTYTETTFA